MQKSVSIFLFIMLSFLLVACGRGEVVTPVVPTEFVRPADLTATAEAALAVAEAEAEAAEEETEEVALGDAAIGDVLFHEMQSVGFACSTCHYADQETRLIGPGLLGIGDNAASRVAGESAEEYLRNAILHPDDYLVETFPAGLMPQTYADVFSEEDVNNLIAYLLSL